MRRKMGTTQPIRNKETIEVIKKYFKENNVRNYLLFVLGINTALRISDILKLKWKDIYDFKNDEIKSHIALVEQKTGKETLVAINQSVKAALETFRNTNKVRPDEFIFRSRKGENKPIGRTRAYTIFADAAKSLNIEKFSCHSLRKTFGYHAWKKNQNPVLLMEVYNHSSFAITRKYLGILQEDKDSVFLSILL